MHARGTPSTPGHGPRSPRRRFLALATALALLLLAPAGPAWAGEVPESALSRSLSLPPLLVDSPQLAFQFPQLAANRDSTALAFGAVPLRSVLFGSSTSSPGYAGAGILRTASVAGFGMAQSSYLASSAYAYFSYDRGSVLQAGIAASAGAWRCGAAFRGSRDRNEWLREQGYGTQVSTEVNQETTSHLEGAFGVGAQFRGVTLDLVGEIYSQKYETGTLYLSTSDTVAAQGTGKTHAYGGGAVRLAVPVGEAVRVVAAGTYTHGDLVWSGLTYNGLRLDALDMTQGIETWSAGLAVLCRAPYVDVLSVAGQFTRTYQPLASANHYDGWMRGEPDRREARWALGCQRQMWRTLQMQAGLYMQWSKYNTDVYMKQVEANGRTINYKSRDEELTHGFSTGLAYAWRRLVLAAALNNDLPLGDLFATVDLRIDL